jgi:hypothetical protein
MADDPRGKGKRKVIRTITEDDEREEEREEERRRTELRRKALEDREAERRSKDLEDVYAQILRDIDAAQGNANVNAVPAAPPAYNVNNNNDPRNALPSEEERRRREAERKEAQDQRGERQRKETEGAFFFNFFNFFLIFLQTGTGRGGLFFRAGGEGGCSPPCTTSPARRGWTSWATRGGSTAASSTRFKTRQT